jgi:hypothetical protein
MPGGMQEKKQRKFKKDFKGGGKRIRDTGYRIRGKAHWGGE